MADINALKKQRSVNKGKVTLILISVRKTSDISIEECRVRLNRVEKLMEEFTVIENRIFALDQSQEPDLDYEENYYKVVTELNKLIRKLGFNNPNANASFESPLNATQSGADVRLPKLNIPVFSGDYTEWQSFYDLYVSSIHDSTSLSPVQKFQYLKGLLRGEAASLLRHFSITEANYIEALQKLRHRYDRKRHTINAFIRTFIEQPSINVANNVNIKRLLDTSDEVLRGLKAMGPQGEQRDSWLVYILVNKLDDESKGLWAQTTAEKECPTIQEFFDFLLRRGDALESLRSTTKRSSSSINKQPLIKGHVAVRDSKCPIYQADGHLIYQCPVFNGMDVYRRREVIKNNRRCFNCLSDKHAIFKCLSKRRCPVCRGKHNTLLHLPETQLTTDMNKVDSKDEPTTSCGNAVLSYCNGNSIAQSIVPTALTDIVCSSGQTVRCRVLLDSGSQESIITESCIQRLGIPRYNGRISVKGIGQVESGTTKGVAYVHIHPQSGPTLTIKVFIMKRITKLPLIDISSANMDTWENVPLADPEFYKANEIDLLIGIDHFFNILIDGQIRRNLNQLVLQNTIFGWIVAGTISDNTTNAEAPLHGFMNNIIESNIDETLKRFWKLESIPNVASVLSPEEELCERSFKDSHRMNSEGRFQVPLTFQEISIGIRHVNTHGNSANEGNGTSVS